MIYDYPTQDPSLPTSTSQRDIDRAATAPRRRTLAAFLGTDEGQRWLNRYLADAAGDMADKVATILITGCNTVERLDFVNELLRDIRHLYSVRRDFVPLDDNGIEDADLSRPDRFEQE